MAVECRAMPNNAASGFWSYAHDDNKLDGGALLELARLISEEYDLLSGEPLELFIDRDSIAWGEEWRQRIAHALTKTTFFIPVITPRYFMRPECRRELLEFAAKAKSLGVEELILPVLYVDTAGLSTDSPDEAVALIARTQYVDWRTIRLLEPNSREYRGAVSVLACRLLEIAKEVVEKQIKDELSINPGDDEATGVADIVEEVKGLQPEWLEAVMGDKTNTAQIRATFADFSERVQKLRKSKASPSAIMAVQMRLGKEALPLLERFHEESRVYSALSIKMDPLISTLARLVVAHPDSYMLVAPIREAIDEAMESIQYAKEMQARGHIPIHETLASMRHLSRTFQKCYAITLDAMRLSTEGNTIVERWNNELRRIDPYGSDVVSN